MQSTENVNAVVVQAIHGAVISLGETPATASNVSSQVARWMQDNPGVSTLYLVRNRETLAVEVVEDDLGDEPLVMTLPIKKWAAAAKVALKRLAPADSRRAAGVRAGKLPSGPRG
jgi:hypothetical protein